MPSKRIRAIVRQEGSNRWIGRAPGLEREMTTRSKEACVRRLEEALSNKPGGPRSLVIEVEPKLIGVAEAAEVIGWDKRHVITYLNRGKFPDPVASLAGGRIWALDDVVAFARGLRDRRGRRSSPD